MGGNEISSLGVNNSIPCGRRIKSTALERQIGELEYRLNQIGDHETLCSLEATKEALKHKLMTHARAPVSDFLKPRVRF